MRTGTKKLIRGLANRRKEVKAHGGYSRALQSGTLRRWKKEQGSKRVRSVLKG